MSWDEPMQRDLGNYCLDFITGKNYGLYSMQNRFHGGTFETICALPERIFDLQETKDIYYSRHLMIYLCFWVGTIFFYLLNHRIFGNWKWALLAVAILYITPRIFAHGFYNSKDIPFLTFFLAGIYGLVKFMDKPGLWRAALFALITGAVIGNRILGILIPAFALGTFILLWSLKKVKPKDGIYLLVYFLLVPFATILVWPVLWTEPFYNFVESIRMMKKFPYEDPVLFRWKFIKPADLPWYYVPVWIVISVPVAWQLLFAGGLFGFTWKTLKSRFKNLHYEWPVFLCIGWFFIPWLMVVVLKAVIYDEWRHLFFTYPAFIILGIYGIRQLFFALQKQFSTQHSLIPYLIFIPLLWQFSVTAIYMVRWNPYQGMYFNVFAGKNITGKYEMDYWGVSYREAWEYLVQNEKKEKIEVMWQNPSGEYNLAMLPATERARLIPTYYLDCEYFLTDYRFYPSYPDQREKYYSIIVDGMEICTIFKNPGK